MNAWLLIALSLLSTTARASVSNVLAKRFVQAGEDARLFNTIAGLAASALLFIVSASREPDGTGMLPLALVFGLVYFAAFTSYSKAMSLGPMSYTSLATSLGMVLPVIAGPLAWGESIRPPDAPVGILGAYIIYLFRKHKHHTESVRKQYCRFRSGTLHGFHLPFLQHILTAVPHSRIEGPSSALRSQDSSQSVPGSL